MTTAGYDDGRRCRAPDLEEPDDRLGGIRLATVVLVRHRTRPLWPRAAVDVATAENGTPLVTELRSLFFGEARTAMFR